MITTTPSAPSTTPTNTTASNTTASNTTGSNTTGSNTTGSNTTAKTVRVAVREIREATYRALIAAGASAGEASTAAALALHAEIHCGKGIIAALDELPLVPSSRIPMLRDPQHPDRLIDPAGRGPLLRVPAAADLAAATREPLLLSEMPWQLPVMMAALHRTCIDQGTVLAAIEVTATGAIGQSVIGYSDGAADWATDQSATTALLDRIGYQPASDEALTAGVLLIPADLDPTDIDTTPVGIIRTGRQSAADINRRTTTAFAGGVQVDAAGWAALYAAAGLFLVPER